MGKLFHLEIDNRTPVQKIRSYRRSHYKFVDEILALRTIGLGGRAALCGELPTLFLQNAHDGSKT